MTMHSGTQERSRGGLRVESDPSPPPRFVSTLMWCCLYGSSSVHCFCLLAQQLSVFPVCAACYCKLEAQQDWEKHMDVHTLELEKSCNTPLNDHFGILWVSIIIVRLELSDEI